MTRWRRWRLRLRRSSLIALVITLGATAAAAWTIHSVVGEQEHRLLRGRAAEVNLVLASSVATLQTTLSAQGSILRATGNSVQAYESAAARDVAAAGPNEVGFAWLRPEGSGWTVLASAGGTFHDGQTLTDERVGVFAQASRSGKPVPTPVMGSERRLGFAIGAPAAPEGTVLYRESALGPVAAPRAAGTAPFTELDVVLFTTPKPDAGQVLVSTSGKVPLRGDVRTEPLLVGDTVWTLSVKARRPLVGSTASDAWWLTALVGVIGSLLVAALVDAEGRRREAALELYASEHQLAETLQLSLLPQLPTLPHVETAARYLAAGTGQQVGGDWFDVFPVRGGRVGIVVGDVIGHDLTAAAAMAEVRASLRAFAIDGSSPASVINQLDRLIKSLELTQLVTAVYGLLEPIADDGSRELRYTNAGHLPPLLRGPDGSVRPLTGGDTIILGAPLDTEHIEGREHLLPGTTLIFFTDGLVETPGGSLSDALDELADTVTALSTDLDLDSLCEQMVQVVPARPLRDDIVLLAARTS